jgi:hypothetical protein
MNPTKLAFIFSAFSVIFYTIYKIEENGNTIRVTLLQERPWKELGVCNVAPGMAGRRGWAKFRRPAALGCGEKAGEGSRLT